MYAIYAIVQRKTTYRQLLKKHVVKSSGCDFSLRSEIEQDKKNQRGVIMVSFFKFSKTLFSIIFCPHCGFDCAEIVQQRVKQELEIEKAESELEKRLFL